MHHILIRFAFKLPTVLMFLKLTYFKYSQYLKDFSEFSPNENSANHIVVYLYSVLRMYTAILTAFFINNYKNRYFSILIILNTHLSTRLKKNTIWRSCWNYQFINSTHHQQKKSFLQITSYRIQNIKSNNINLSLIP